MFRSVFLRECHKFGYKAHDHILNAYIGNPFFMEAKLKNHVDVSDFKDIAPEKLKQTLDALFLQKNTAKFLDALDKYLFNIKELLLCTPAQRNEYLQKLSNNEHISLNSLVKHDQKKTLVIDKEVSGFTRR